MFLKCLTKYFGFASGRALQYKKLIFPLNSYFTQSTKKNKRIVEKSPLLSKEPINETKEKNAEKADFENFLEKPNLEKKISEPEKPNAKPIDIVEELKTKRYKYSESDQKMIVIDKNARPVEKKQDKTEQKLSTHSEPTERVSKYLSRSGICSRREAEKLIKKGMIYVNNKKVDSNVAVSDSSKIKIYTKDGGKVPMKEETKLWMFYKPKGLICTTVDRENRPNIFQYLNDKTHLKIDHLISVGSMDFNCEGLLLITNDGGLARTLELPKNNLQRAYHIRVYGRFTPEKLSKIRSGVIISGKRYGPFWAEIFNRQTSNTWLHVKMDTGKIREIRKIMQKLDLRVNRIKRIGYGPYKIGKLIPGDLVEIEVAPQIKKIVYLNAKNKLMEHQAKIKEKLGTYHEEKSIGHDERKQIGSERTDVSRGKISIRRRNMSLIDRK